MDAPSDGFPRLRQVVLDCTDARKLAEFCGVYADLAGHPFCIFVAPDT